MRDRLSSFSDPEIVELLQTRFVAATDNDWYNRRRKDEIGNFFMSVVNQHPHPRNHHTKQGHYIFTASGKLLGFNNNRDKRNRMKFISDALQKWDALPDSEKGAGSVNVKPLSEIQLDKKYHSDPPPNGVVLVASARILKWHEGQLLTCQADDHDHPWGHLAAADRMWLQKSELDSLIKAGEQNAAIPDRVAHRLARYHLLDFTRGEPEPWQLSAIKKIDTQINKVGNGKFQLLGSFQIEQGDRGFEATMQGQFQVDRSGQIQDFNITVLGDHWGHGTYTQGSRPGRTPLGIAFKLADMELPENQIRPQGSHWLLGYWQAEVQF